MERMYEKFTNCYSAPKTLSFKGIPTEETKKHLELQWEALGDEIRFENYDRMKMVLDQLHRAYISRKFENMEEESVKKIVEILKEIVLVTKKLTTTNQEDKKKVQNQLQLLQASLRKEIGKMFPKKEWVQLQGKNVFKMDGVLSEYNISEDDKKSIQCYDGFMTFFKKYNETRANIYSTEEKSTAITFRIVNDNLPKYVRNVDNYHQIKELLPEVLEQVEKLYPNLIEYFTIENYMKYWSQKGIETYNTVIGEINKQVNLVVQQRKDSKFRKYKMQVLYQQILSDREEQSFVYQQDQEVFDDVNEFAELVNGSAFNEAIELLKSPNIDENEIFIPYAKLAEVSIKMKMGWNGLESAFINDLQQQYPKKDHEKLLEQLKKEKKVFSLQEIKDVVMGIEHEENWHFVSLLDCVEEYQKQLTETRDAYVEYAKTYAGSTSSSLQGNDVAAIKAFLDSCLQLVQWCKLFEYSDLYGNRDKVFYGGTETILLVFASLISVYNKTRNYVTMRPGQARKMHLMFNYPEFGGGFSDSKVDSYGTILLREGKKYYLAVIKKGIKISLEDTINENDCYERLSYMLFPDVKKMIPKCSICVNDVKDHFKNSDEDYNKIMNDKYAKELLVEKEDYDLYFVKLYDDKKMFQKNYLNKTGDEKGYRQALERWIRFCIRFLRAYNSTKDYDLSELEPISKFRSLDEFYDKLDTLLYKIEWKKISREQIKQMESSGQLFLFELYNKDFSEHAKGKKNLFTLYWEQIFREENLKQPVIKLCGGAEMFYRKVAIQKPFVHKKGSILVDKTYVDQNGVRKTLPDNIYKEWSDFMNKKITSVSQEASEYKDFVKCHEAKYDITKDKRYTTDQFEFHVPITLNYSALGKGQLNDSVLDCLCQKEKYNVIGIDRGERNLLAYCVVNQDGQILEQGTFNKIVGGNKQEVDYKQKLQEKEVNRQEARKEWKNIGKIKELKSGYLSQVIYQLTQMMVKYDAIVVMEDLNVGFKRGRFKVERQVYQKFEKALIDKLNYLVTTKDESEYGIAGSVSNAYQLTEKFKSFKDMGKQNGMLFYVPAGYTSKIDPTTGFVDVLNRTGLTNANARKEFFANFDDIIYSKEDNMFAFSFDYSKFKAFQEMHRKKWTVYTNGKKFIYSSKERKEKQIDVTGVMKEILSKVGITEYDNLYSKIMNVAADKEHADFWKSLQFVFDRTMQLRSSQIDNGEDNLEDKIISPVKNAEGVFYESNGNYGDTSQPADADTNGAFHIARKGLLLAENVKKTGRGANGKWNSSVKNISNKDWFAFVQK